MLSRRAGITFAMFVLAAATAAHGAGSDQPPAAADSKTAGATTATPAPGANAAGAMVFIDPATGKIVQPTEAQLGSLATSPQAGLKAKAAVVTIQGPGGAVGIVLTPETFSYSVATRTAEGKIFMDCVTGGQAADRIVAGESSIIKATPKAQGPLDEKKK